MKWNKCCNGRGLLYLPKCMTLTAELLEQQSLTSLATEQHHWVDNNVDNSTLRSLPALFLNSLGSMQPGNWDPLPWQCAPCSLYWHKVLLKHCTQPVAHAKLPSFQIPLSHLGNHYNKTSTSVLGMLRGSRKMKGTLTFWPNALHHHPRVHTLFGSICKWQRLCPKVPDMSLIPTFLWDQTSGLCSKSWKWRQ